MLCCGDWIQEREDSWRPACPRAAQRSACPSVLGMDRFFMVTGLCVEGRGVAWAHPVLAWRPCSSTWRTSGEQLSAASVCPLTHVSGSPTLHWAPCWTKAGCESRRAGDGGGGGLGEGPAGKQGMAAGWGFLSAETCVCKAPRPEYSVLFTEGVSMGTAWRRGALVSSR